MLVQVRGLPGSGKSVVVRRAVQRALEHGPILFLKAEQLEGTSWISYATSQGLSGAPLEQLLVEIGAAGTPILFIDAIDRIEKEHQPVILDVIRTIVDSPLLDNWRVVVSLRDTGIEVLRNWLGEFLDALKVETLKRWSAERRRGRVACKSQTTSEAASVWIRSSARNRPTALFCESAEPELRGRPQRSDIRSPI